MKKGVCFPNILKKYPLLRARRRPEGAAGGGARGIFSKYLENRPLFSKYLEKRPIHIFLIDTFQFFQITTIYKGTQVTTVEQHTSPHNKNSTTTRAHKHNSQYNGRCCFRANAIQIHSESNTEHVTLDNPYGELPVDIISGK